MQTNVYVNQQKGNVADKNLLFVAQFTVWKSAYSIMTSPIKYICRHK